MRIACWIPKAADRHTHTHTHTFAISYTHCFPTTTMVERTRLNVTLYIQFIVCLVTTMTQLQRQNQPQFTVKVFYIECSTMCGAVMRHHPAFL